MKRIAAQGISILRPAAGDQGAGGIGGQHRGSEGCHYESNFVRLHCRSPSMSSTTEPSGGCAVLGAVAAMNIGMAVQASARHRTER